MTLQVENVFAGYGDIRVLSDISFDVPGGQILGVLGRNGMGKTTLIRVLSGQILPAQGRVLLDGEDISRLLPYERARRGLTTIVQGRGVFPKLTVKENLQMGHIACGRVRRNRMDEVLECFPRLKERLRQQAGTMSGGEQQMLAISRGLMTDPSVMLLDEPSDGIMPTLVAQITKTLRDLNRNDGLTLIIVEQNVPMVFELTEDCIILEKGRIVAKGKRNEIARSEVMREYLAI